MASWTAFRCASEHILEYTELDHNVAIFELEVPVQWDGKTLLQLDIRRRFGINVLGIREKGGLNMNVRPEMQLSSNQSILVAGNEKEVHRCFRI